MCNKKFHFYPSAPIKLITVGFRQALRWFFIFIYLQLIIRDSPTGRYANQTKIESRVPHLKPIEAVHMVRKYLLAYSCLIKCANTVSFHLRVAFPRLVHFDVSQLRMWCRERWSENGYDVRCALFVITSIFKPRPRKVATRWEEKKRRFAKCNFQRSITISRERERDYSRNFSKWHDSVNTFTT